MKDGAAAKYASLAVAAVAIAHQYPRNRLPAV